MSAGVGEKQTQRAGGARTLAVDWMNAAEGKRASGKGRGTTSSASIQLKHVRRFVHYSYGRIVKMQN